MPVFILFTSLVLLYLAITNKLYYIVQVILMDKAKFSGGGDKAGGGSGGGSRGFG